MTQFLKECHKYDVVRLALNSHEIDITGGNLTSGRVRLPSVSRVVSVMPHQITVPINTGAPSPFVFLRLNVGNTDLNQFTSTNHTYALSISGKQHSIADAVAYYQWPSDMIPIWRTPKYIDFSTWWSYAWVKPDGTPYDIQAFTAGTGEWLVELFLVVICGDCEAREY